MAMALDTRREIETPEGVVLSERVAGPLPRALAWGVDLLARMMLYAVLATALELAGAFAGGLMLILLFVLEWGYGVVFELMLNGRTPGKLVLGLQTVMDDGTPVTPRASILRNLLRVADFLPVGFLVGLLSALVDPYGRRLGDLAAGTLVVYRRAAAAERRPLPPGPVAPPPTPLRPEEQQTLVDLAQRGPGLSVDRHVELAEIVGVGWGLSGKAALDRATAVARFVRGDAPGGGP
ncbi:MAG: hypothetical protein RIT28_2991 [Pseudomonadota bacterium]